VRVVEVRIEPDVKPGMHTHPYAHVGAILDDGTLQLTTPAARVKEPGSNREPLAGATPMSCMIIEVEMK
jgi:hypothetical protein